MKMYLTLFRKEIKNMYRELLLVLILQIGYLIYGFLRFSGQGLRASPVERFIIELFNTSFFLFPALLVYSLYIEERTGTLYQAHSLPVRRLLLRIKFFIVLSAFGIAVLVVSVISLIASSILSRSASPDVVASGLIDLLRFPFISLCLVCTAWGFMQLQMRNRLVTGLAVGIAGFGLYFMLIDTFMAYHNLFQFGILNHAIYTLIMGAVFACIGFFVYERYSEI